MIRCSKCLLTNSLPGSDFDDSNTCSWCRSNYPNYRPKGTKQLEELLKHKCSNKSPADCLVGLSGGKDSSYALWELKKTFDVRVEAFTYSHFGLNDFALNNARSLCSDLGVKHHVVSLPGESHLASFQRYFKAWSHNPSTISAGLTCVACKHLHILGNKLAQERNIPIVCWSNCPLEYAPFLAVKMLSNGNYIQRSGLIASGFNFLKELSKSRILFQSLISDFSTTIRGCFAVSPTTWYMRHKYSDITQLFFYDYYEWNPDLILHKLQSESAWKRPVDFPDDWHSDCLFEALKQYMFQKMLGVSYTDSFLSSQIRHGLITRESAWRALVESKKFYSDLLPSTLNKVGLGEYENSIDYACFEIDS